MRKSLLIGLIVCVLALGGIGAAFATDMEVTKVGALSLGWEQVEQVNCDFVGYELTTSSPGPGKSGVAVDGVYISFDKPIHSSNNSTVIFVSLRAGNWSELAYCVATVSAGTTLTKGTVYKFPCADDTTADPRLVKYVKVMVAENSAYSHNGTDHGQGGVIDMPDVMGQ